MDNLVISPIVLYTYALVAASKYWTIQALSHNRVYIGHYVRSYQYGEERTTENRAYADMLSAQRYIQRQVKIARERLMSKGKV